MSLWVDKELQKGMNFVYMVANYLDVPRHPLIAVEIIESVFTDLRDCINIPDSCKIISKLPSYVSDIYLENWDVFKLTKRISLQKYRQELKENYPKESKNLESVLMAISQKNTKDRVKEMKQYQRALIHIQANNLN